MEMVMYMFQVLLLMVEKIMELEKIMILWHWLSKQVYLKVDMIMEMVMYMFQVLLLMVEKIMELEKIMIL